jgi:hypothetical protein
MVRHILKKDWTLLWPLVTASAVLFALLASARFSAGLFVNGLPMVPASLLELLAAAAIITLVVHQDPIPGARQDWLVRPVSRRDLFLAKLLFVLIFMQGPWWVTDVAQGLANGFPWGQSVSAATACAVWVLLTLTVPVLAFATLTATMTETFIAALAACAMVIAFLIVPGLVGATRPTALTGFAWVPALLREALLLVSAAGVLILQYRWRRTGSARALFAGALFLGLCIPFLPWRTTFRVEQWLTAGAQDNHGINAAFASGAARFRPAPGQGLDDVLEKPGLGPADVAAENQRRHTESVRTVFLPVRVSGLLPAWRLLADRSDVRLSSLDHRIFYEGTGNDLELHATNVEAIVHQGIRVPGAVYNRVKGEPLDVQLDYSFTLFRPDATYALPARGGDQRMPGIGWCATTVDAAGTRVLFQCMQPGERPSCLAVVIEHPPTQQRNPEVSLCAPDYSPYPGHTLPDALSRFGGRRPFYDPAGLIQYPVGGPQLSEARVLVTAFRPTEHFLRRVVIPAVRLEDWEPATGDGRPQSARMSRFVTAAAATRD